MKRMQTGLRVAFAVLATAGLMACGNESAPSGQTGEVSATGQITTGQIKGAGATFPEPLYQEWIRRYSAEHPDVGLSYEGVGSGEGIKRFIAGRVDFGASDAAMKDAEIAQVERGVKLIPATAGMVVLAYNLPDLNDPLRLPRDVYVDIFAGRIWRWDDERLVAANPDLDLPPQLIQVVARRDSSGTTFAMTNHLSAINADWHESGQGLGKQIDWPGGAMTARGNEGVAQRVKISRGAIGYMEYGFAKRLGLPMAVLENEAGRFVMPDAQSGRAALAAAAPDLPDDLRLFLPDAGGQDSYPIVSLSWLLLYGRYADPTTAQSLKDAVSWGLTEGQSVAEAMGYIPLPEEVTSKALQALASIQ